MTSSVKITASRTARRAIVYVRQSSARQLEHNHESRELQYALVDRARALGWKRAAMADPAAAQRLTGYILGGISPFGTKKTLPLVADRSLAEQSVVHVSGGRRGLEIRIAPADLTALLSARIAAIAIG